LFSYKKKSVSRKSMTIGNRFGRKDPLLARATSSKIEQKQQAQLMKTNPVGAANSANVAEKKGVAAICEEKDTFKSFKRFMWSIGSPATPSLTSTSAFAFLVLCYRRHYCHLPSRYTTTVPFRVVDPKLGEILVPHDPAVSSESLPR
jgi:hypothetical protein